MLSTQKRGNTYRVEKVKGIVLFHHLIDFASWLGDRLGFQIVAEGLERLEGDSRSIRFKLRPGTGAAGATLPLNVNADGTVVPGTIGGAMPKIGTDRLDASPAPTLTIPGSGTRYVIATITGQMTARTLAGQIYTHATLANLTVAISLTSTAPVAADLQATFPGAGTLSSFKIHLATFVDGNKTAQNGYGPITYLLQDNLDGSGLTTLIPTWASIVA